MCGERLTREALLCPWTAVAFLLLGANWDIALGAEEKRDGGGSGKDDQDNGAGDVERPGDAHGGKCSHLEAQERKSRLK